ncbi:MAG: hypothetical protein NW220_21765 [Leptolyngbyaceae cyanobacterium bins.349]|nr:hypothetical protein [Leptolyngbyaceae cyanobacterium bins.349]
MMSRAWKFLILAISLLIVTSWWFFGNLKDAVSHDWQPLATAPPALIQQFQKDLGWGKQCEAILKSQFLQVMQPGQVAPLYLIDAGSTIRLSQRPSLCGQMGCLFAGYLQRENKSFQQVTSGYLSQSLPSKTNKVEVVNAQINGLPCLRFNQLSQSRFDPHLVSVIYCFDGNTYTQNLIRN